MLAAAKTSGFGTLPQPQYILVGHQLRSHTEHLARLSYIELQVIICAFVCQLSQPQPLRCEMLIKVELHGTQQADREAPAQRAAASTNRHRSVGRIDKDYVFVTLACEKTLRGASQAFERMHNTH